MGIDDRQHVVNLCAQNDEIDNFQDTAQIMTHSVLITALFVFMMYNSYLKSIDEKLNNVLGYWQWLYIAVCVEYGIAIKVFIGTQVNRTKGD